MRTCGMLAIIACTLGCYPYAYPKDFVEAFTVVNPRGVPVPEARVFLVERRSATHQITSAICEYNNKTTVEAVIAVASDGSGVVRFPDPSRWKYGLRILPHTEESVTWFYEVFVVSREFDVRWLSDFPSGLNEEGQFVITRGSLSRSISLNLVSALLEVMERAKEVEDRAGGSDVFLRQVIQSEVLKDVGG